MVQAAAPALHSVVTGEGNIFSFVRPLDFVALALHEDNKILLAGAELHGFTNVIHQPELPALPLLCCPPFPGGHLLATTLILGQDTETMCHADIITDQPQELQRVGILPQF